MSKPQNLIGKKFSRLTVTGKVGRRGAKVFWECLCDCGKRVEVYTGVLNSGRTKSCGCWTKDRLRDRNILPFGFAARNIILSIYKSNAAKKSLPWCLSPEQFMQITSQACRYCNAPPSNYYIHRRSDGNDKLNGGFKYSGIDRVDNTLGYIEDNCVPCCNICNKAKRDMTYDDFMKWIDNISNHRAGSRVCTLAAGS